MKDIWIRFLSIDAYNKESIILFYKKNLFEALQLNKNRRNMSMYRDLCKKIVYLLNLIFSKVFLALSNALISSFIEGVFNLSINRFTSAQINVGVGFTLLALYLKLLLKYAKYFVSFHLKSIHLIQQCGSSNFNISIF